MVALAAWSMVMLVWLYATRIPAMRAAKLRPGQATKADMEALPKWATNVAANYNHLMEQPTLFYVICISLQLLGETNDINIGLAWLYVVLRVVHSLVQATVNIIPLRWLIFMTASVVLAMLTFHAAMGLGWVNLSWLHHG